MNPINITTIKKITDPMDIKFAISSISLPNYSRELIDRNFKAALFIKMPLNFPRYNVRQLAPCDVIHSCLDHCNISIVN